jgi:8-oxo-dGTP diphosphatase
MIEFGEKKPGVRYEDRPASYGFLLAPDKRLALIRTPMGLFLPGGGLEAQETFEQTLAREFMEEIGYQVSAAVELGQAVQYHWSEFYQTHFRKEGHFFAVQAQPVPGKTWQKDHELIWRPHSAAVKELTQEFQRWATLKLLTRN